MEKIKTAIVLPYFGTGGAEKMVAQLAAGLDRNAFKTEVFCVYGEPLGNHMEQLLQEKGIQIHYIGKKLGFSFSAMRKLFRELDAFDPDVVHTHLYACLYTIPWPILRRKPWIHTVHAHPELENRRFLRRVLSKILIRTRIMTPVAISHQNRKLLCAYYGLSEDRIPVVYNPVDIHKFAARKKKTSETFTFITAGRFSPEKNQTMMFRAFGEFLKKGYDARLIMLGKGPEEEKLKNLAREMEIDDRILYAGFVVNVEDYLTDGDVFLLSSNFEALPLAVLEAMAAGLPVVATDVGGVRDIVTDNGILIPKEDVSLMARAMEKLYLDTECRKKMSQCALANVAAYDAANAVAGYSAIYRHVTGKMT